MHHSTLNVRRMQAATHWSTSVSRQAACARLSLSKPYRIDLSRCQQIRLRGSHSPARASPHNSAASRLATWLTPLRCTLSRTMHTSGDGDGGGDATHQPTLGAWRALETPPAELQLAFTLPTGQSFRWVKVGDNEYAGVIRGRLVSTPRSSPAQTVLNPNASTRIPPAHGA
jgi:hypothetical protein